MKKPKGSHRIVSLTVFRLLTAFIILTVSLSVVYTKPVLAGQLSPPAGSSKTQPAGRPEYLNSRPLEAKESNIEISGELPVFTGLTYNGRNHIGLQNILNERITRLYNAKVTKAKKSGYKTLAFSFAFKEYGDYSTVLLYSGQNLKDNKDNKESVDAISYSLALGKPLELKDVLGVNAVVLCDKIIADEIKKNPDKYNPDFDGITPSQNFYVENNNLVLLFNENEIASAKDGIQQITIDLNNVKTIVLEKTGYYVMPNYFELKMVPLRAVCDGLDYAVSWNEATKAIEVTKGDFSTSLTIGKNAYTKGKAQSRSLETVPVLKNGVCYVPVSFFEVILDAKYTIGDNLQITFSCYN